MSCALCPNPALCNPVCRAFEFAPAAVRAQMREACVASGQMTAQEVSAHVEAGEMPECGPGEADCALCNGRGVWGIPGARCSFCKGTGRVKFWRPRDDAAPKGEAGEMEAAKGDATPLPTNPQQEKPRAS